MLYYDFEDYDEFKMLFGTRTCGNGAVSRKNNVLLSLYKDKRALHLLRLHKEYRDANGLDAFCLTPVFSNIDNLFHQMKRALRDERFLVDDEGYGTAEFGTWNIYLGNGDTFCTGLFCLDDNDGLTEKVDINVIRFAHAKAPQKFYRMKAGKFCRALLEENYVTRHLPEQIKVAFCEDFAERWRAWASQFTDEGYELHVGNSMEDFMKIYSSSFCADDFGSCMIDDEQYPFWKKEVKCHAAYLTRMAGDENLIYARCIIYDEVHDDDTGETLRLAERQYSYHSKDSIKRILVDKLIKGGYIDGYKRVGMGAHDITAFVSNDGDDWSNRKFSIENTVDWNKCLSYQDSFRYYDKQTNRAYNYCNINEEDLLRLDRCISTLEPEEFDVVYSNRYDDYILTRYATYVGSIRDYVDRRREDLVWASDTGDYEFADQCTEVGGAFYLHPPKVDEQKEMPAAIRVRITTSDGVVIGEQTINDWNHIRDLHLLRLAMQEGVLTDELMLEPLPMEEVVAVEPFVGSVQNLQPRVEDADGHILLDTAHSNGEIEF